MEKRSGRVTIISRESDERTLDIAMLEAELRSRGIDVRVMSRLLTKDSVVKAAGYLGHALKQEAAILASDVVVLDTYCIPASMIPHRKGTKVVQMWHALSAIKKFGWQTVGKEGGSSEKVAKLMRMHHGYDHVVCASDVTAKHFCEAFSVGPDKIVKYGLPRIDYIKSVAGGERYEDTAKRIYSRYPELRKDPSAAPHSAQDDGGYGHSVQENDRGRKTVLYAPTFRPGQSVDVQSLAAALDPDRYDLVVKLHPLYRGQACTGDGSLCTGDKACTGDGSLCMTGDDHLIHVIFDEEFSSFDWLAATDIVISDYSSLVVEATLADKPLYIYDYDIDDYARGTGLNIDFESEPIAPYVFRDAKVLAEQMDRDREGPGSKGDKGEVGTGYDLSALRAFRDKYIDIDTGDGTGADNYVTARLADFIESLI